MLFMCMCVLPCSVMSNYVMLWTVAHQALLSMGILQARILEWVAISSSRGSSQPRTEPRCLILQAYDLLSEPPAISKKKKTKNKKQQQKKTTWPSISNSDFPTSCPFSPSHCFCVKSGLSDTPQLF